jgi:hypothetical protein
MGPWDSMPVARSRVRAKAWACWRLTSISSYSTRPSWTTVRPPAWTQRRDGKVGSPVSVAPPSAVRPRSTTPKAHSAREVAAGRGRGNRARSRWSRTRLVKAVSTRTRDSPARSSTRVVTAVSWRTSDRSARVDEPGQANRASMATRARSGPCSTTRTTIAEGDATSVSVRGGQ